MYIYIYVYIYVSIYLYLYLYISIFLYLYIYIYIYIHTYILPIFYHQCEQNQFKEKKKGRSKYQTHDYTQLIVIVFITQWLYEVKTHNIITCLYNNECYYTLAAVTTQLIASSKNTLTGLITLGTLVKLLF